VFCIINYISTLMVYFNPNIVTYKVGLTKAYLLLNDLSLYCLDS